MLRVRTGHIAGVKTVELQIPRPSDSKVDFSNEKSDGELGQLWRVERRIAAAVIDVVRRVFSGVGITGRRCGIRAVIEE